MTSKREQLVPIAQLIDSHHDWWRFPTQEPVQGFMGTGPVIIVGDQPSTSSWEESHPNRRVFYGLLPTIDAANAHLTDLYKRRGPAGELKRGLPPDFQEHLAIFQQELAILQPHRVIALGRFAFELLNTHVPQVTPMLAWMWHFSYVGRYGKEQQYEANARKALGA